jgi:heat shock protein 5
MKQFSIIKIFLSATGFSALLRFIPCLFTGVHEPSDDQDYGTVIGLDLGTTFSCVAVFKNGQVEVNP